MVEVALLYIMGMSEKCTQPIPSDSSVVPAFFEQHRALACGGRLFLLPISTGLAAMEQPNRATNIKGPSRRQYEAVLHSIRNTATMRESK